jgi:hypothetical protein
VLASLKNAGISVRALGTKDIGGVSCTGYAVTPPGAQGTIAAWIDPQHLVREVNVNVAFGLPLGGASASATPSNTGSAPAVDLMMDFSYSATPVHVTAPSAASTMPLADWLKQIGSLPSQ